MSHLPSNMSDLVRDLITLRGNGSLDLNIVLSDLLVFRMAYPPKYFCNSIQLFQNNISAFPKVTNYTVRIACAVASETSQRRRTCTLARALALALTLTTRPHSGVAPREPPTLISYCFGLSLLPLRALGSAPSFPAVPLSCV